MNTRRGDWIQTFRGGQFWPLDPRFDEVFIEDIAHALSMQCRFTGHCLRFYSVAEHSVFVSYAVPQEFALWGLLHDASEAYLVDLARPVKRSVVGYAEAEDVVMRVICERFGLSTQMPAAVKRADEAVLATEMAQNMAPPPSAWNLAARPLEDMQLRCLSPDEAEAWFLQRFEQLTRA